MPNIRLLMDQHAGQAAGQADLNGLLEEVVWASTPTGSGAVHQALQALVGRYAAQDRFHASVKPLFGSYGLALEPEGTEPRTANPSQLTEQHLRWRLPAIEHLLQVRTHRWQAVVSDAEAARELAYHLSQAPREEVARALSSMGPGSSTWLTHLPMAQSEELGPGEFARAILLRLGASTRSTFSAAKTCLCGKAYNSDEMGEHFLVCHHVGPAQERGVDMEQGQPLAGWWRRHNALREVCAPILARAAGVQAVREPHIDSPSKLRADLMVPWALGKHSDASGNPTTWDDAPLGHLYLDTTCVLATAGSHVQGAAKSTGQTAGAAEQRKREHYSHLLRQADKLETFAVEAHGHLGEGAQRVIKEAAAACAERETKAATREVNRRERRREVKQREIAEFRPK